MKRLSIVLSGLLLAMVLSLSIGTALAYFTANTEAEGGIKVNFGNYEEIKEDLSDWTKHVTITSKADSEPVYIRAKAFVGSQSGLTLDYSGTGWTGNPASDWARNVDAEGFWYYNGIVYGGGSTSELLVKIDGVPKDAKEGQDFNVAVVFESTPVRYDANGNPYADWSSTLDTGKEGGAD